jgi:hypothetical protein
LLPESSNPQNKKINFSVFHKGYIRGVNSNNCSADTSLLGSGLTMIQTPRNTRSLRLISFPKSSSTKSGITRITSLISNGSIRRKSSLSADARNATSMMHAPVPAVTLLSLTSTRTMVPRDRSSARSALLHSLRKTIGSQNRIPSSVPTVTIPWFTKKTVNTLLFISA